MTIFTELDKMRYYTPLDRVLNKIKRKGFFLYSSIIVLSTLYVFYTISHLPDVLKIEPEASSKDKIRKKIKHEKKDGERKIKTERRKRAEIREGLVDGIGVHPTREMKIKAPL
mmetsp:Transcript_5750/g.6884  ORF Transcript_5750/g.6884 Transcript_5750/m.6884 type:complete len:113 (-) Transcript_5750:2221-2559(-)